MSLTEEEKRTIREAELLKADIRRELQSPPSGRLSSFQQQVCLLVLGSVLTTLVGGALASWWKHRDWVNQQNYLESQRALDRKYAIIEMTFKEVATTLAAADDVLTTFYGKWPAKELADRRGYWDKTSREWRVNSKIISQNLSVNFTNQQISSQFAEIIDRRRVLGRSIVNLLSDPASKSDRDLQKEIQDAQRQIEEISRQLHECGRLMTAETKKTD